MECELVQKINDATNNEFEFTLKSATLKKDADFIVLELYYKDGTILTPAKKQEIQSIMSSITPQNFRFEVKFVKNFISEERAQEEFKIFMKKNFPSVSYKLASTKFADGKFNFDLLVDELSFEHAKTKNLQGNAAKYFKEKFSEYDYVVSMSSGTVFKEDEEKLLRENFHEEEVDMYALRKIEVTEKEIYIGEEIDEPASYIKDKLLLGNRAVFCGVVKHYKKIECKPKKKNNNKDFDKDDEANENATAKNLETNDPKIVAKNEDISKDSDGVIDVAKDSDDKNGKSYTRKIYKWTLEGFTGSLPCIYYSVKATQAKMKVFEEGKEIIVRGKLEVDKFSGELTLYAEDISFCKRPEKFEEFIVYHQEKPFYEWVKPEKMVTYEQNDLLSFMLEKPVAPFLKDRTFVCYDLETTGLHYEAGDRIIEVGAVKIENGKITEKFVSFVNPGFSIPAKASEVNHIYDKDVKDAPNISQVLQDFFKFTRGATLVGQNIITFDNVFLVNEGKTCRFKFDNDSVDVLDLAHKFVHGVKNYKLATIAEKLGVKLDNAHRAFYDTLATAEVFIKLAEFIK